MPRRTSARHSTVADVPAPIPAAAPPDPASSLSPELATLRTHWKWAAFSQFFYTFAGLLAMDDVSLNDIEDDLARGHNLYLPRVMQRLLYTLSYDRKVSPSNWQTALRKQYLKRDPAANPIGIDSSIDLTRYAPRTESVSTPDPRAKTEDDADLDVKNETPAPDGLTDTAAPGDVEMDDAKDWLELTMLEKLDSMHLLVEWQFQNATRLRTLMKTDDDYATWRIEPVGYDAKMNSYWLIGERLWLQRAPPKSPRGPKNLKRKRPPPKVNGKKTAAKRPRVEKVAAKGKAKSKPKPKSPTPESPFKRHSRAAKAQANLKLDAQAKELEELNRQASAAARGDAGLRTSSRRQPATTSSSHSIGTRTSSRLKGSLDKDEDDEWQAVPDEWLGDDEPVRKSKRRAVSASAASSVSALTELSESEDEDDDEDSSEEEHEEEPSSEEEEAAAVDYEPDAEAGADSAKPSAGFVEWETLCVTLYEWENIAQRWENATHYTEKAFYKMLTKNIVPVITEELRRQEAERRKEMEVVETVGTRKRSSRIAVKESTREEARLAAKQKADEEERNGRAKRAEARQQKEESTRQQREQAREERRLEREAKEAEEARLEEERNRPVDVVTVDPPRPRAQTNGRPARSTQSKAPPKAPPRKAARTESGDWELDCEVCHKHGPNIDGDVRLVSCNGCNKWQHIQCHDAMDRRNGLTLRKWDKVEFFCKRCLHTSYPPRTYNGGGLPLQTSREQYLAHPPAGHAYDHYPPRHVQPLDYASSSSSYAYSQQKPYVSDVRSSSNGHHAYSNGTTPGSAGGGGIAFNHYQPQQHGFSQYPGAGPSSSSAGAGATYGHGHGHGQGQGYPPTGAAGVNGYAEYTVPQQVSSARWDAAPPPPSRGASYADMAAWPQRMSDPYAASYRQNS